MDKANAVRDGLGLGKMTGLNLAAFLEPAEEKFREMPLDAIREDGANPREQFDSETLDELAVSIRSRGVITPISIRSDPDEPGRYIVNHGHRRLRASRLAGRSTIPAVVDESFQDEDRVIENIQRDNLSMIEIAKYIATKLAEGVKQKDIAARIGKSTAYVSNHAQLLDLPEHTKKAVADGLLTDLTAINEIAKAEKKYPEQVRKLTAKGGEITRNMAQRFRKALMVDKALHGQDKNLHQDPPVPTDKKQACPSYGPAVAAYAADTMELTGGWGRGRLVIEHAGRAGVLLLEVRPRDPACVWIRYEDGERREESLFDLKLVAVVADDEDRA